MSYSNILKQLKEKDLLGVNVDIVLAVNSSLCDDVSDEEFDLLCKTVYSCWSRGCCDHIQLIANLVVDLYQNIGCGYRNEEKGLILTKKDLEELRVETVDMLLNKVLNILRTRIAEEWLEND